MEKIINEAMKVVRTSSNVGSDFNSDFMDMEVNAVFQDETDSSM